MKKQNVINLVKYHSEHNNEAFNAEVVEIARDFDKNGDELIAQYLMELVASVDFYTPQSSYKNLKFLEKMEYSNKPLLLPNIIEEDIVGITRAIHNKSGLSKFLFYGKPGCGKTESAYQIARLLNRDILSVKFEQLIDSRLGETSKNIALLFDEVNHLSYNKVIVIFDEIDALVLDRVNQNDLREMGRVTSTFLKELDRLNDNITVIATTNLFNSLDKAIVRRFDSAVSFDRYAKEDLIQIAESLLSDCLKKSTTTRQNNRLFRKILNNKELLPYPGDLKQIIKTAVAFSDATSEYDYLRKLYLALNDNSVNIDIQKLSDSGFTTREIEILTKITRSSVSRKLRS